MFGSSWVCVFYLVVFCSGFYVLVSLVLVGFDVVSRWFLVRFYSGLIWASMWLLFWLVLFGSTLGFDVGNYLGSI